MKCLLKYQWVKLPRELLLVQLKGILGLYIDESNYTVKINSALEGATKIIEVPEGHFYILGDNPAESHDSRYWDNPLIHGDGILAMLFTQ